MTGVRVRPLECGWLTTDAATMVSGTEGLMRMPVGAFLVEHPNGVAVFDTGMHPELEHTTARLRGTGPLFELEMDDHWTLTGQLAEAGVAPEDVDIAVLSHLHVDHSGGLGQLPRARVVAQQTEWDVAFTSGLVEFGIYNPHDFDLGHDRQLLAGELDLFGDGSTLVVPTPGHTAGHQSLSIEGRLLLVGDACYCQLALDTDALPSFGHDPARQRETFAWLHGRQQSGVDLVYSHDEVQWNALPPEL